MESNEEESRRPSRISANLSVNQQCDSIKAASNRSKSNTKIKILPTKSRLKQPVVATSSSKIQTSTQKSHLMKPSATTTTGNIQGTRPTSLALKSVQPDRVPVTHLPSILPKLSNNSQQLISNKKPTTLGSLCSTTNRRSKYLTKTGNTTTSAACSTQKSPSQINNSLPSVAVVHPQHSSSSSLLPSTQRVNSGIVSKLVGPNATTFKSSNQQQSEQHSHRLNVTGSIESGKVGLNQHKDGAIRTAALLTANRKEEKGKESKQDGSQIGAARHVKTTKVQNKTTSTAASTSVSILTLNATTKDKNDQIVLNNDDANNNHLLSVASGNGDKKQHGNNKQSDKHLPGHIQASTTRLTTPATKEDQQTNNCYAHDDAKSTTLTNVPTSGVTTAKSLSFHLKQNNKNPHALNDRILPKPMGQKVLSLMMLDVGLLPANNCTHDQPSSAKRSHVIVQGPSMKEESDINNSSYFIDKNGQQTVFSRFNGGLFGRTNCYNVIDYDGIKQCNDQHVLDGMQTCYVEEVCKRNLRSISLPSSPRLNRSRKQYVDRPILSGMNDFSEELTPNDCETHLNNDSNYLVDKTNLDTLIRSDESSKNDHFLNVYNNRDNHSVASSSCSSLNQCPPLLALSNKLEGLNFDKLANNHANTLLNNEIEVKVEVEKSIIHIPTSDRIVQNKKQHDRHIEVLNNTKTRGSKPGHTDACIQDYSDVPSREAKLAVQKPSRVIQSEAHDSEQCRLTRYDYSELDRKLRLHMESAQRRQQTRSHSISGQEFHANGGYQRLKNLTYNHSQMNYDGQPPHHHNQQHQHQQYHMQTSNRALHMTSPYQQQNNPTGRSPSPLSVNYPLHSQRDTSPRYSSDRPLRSNLHASLECLNSSYVDYTNQHQEQQKPPPPQQQQSFNQMQTQPGYQQLLMHQQQQSAYHHLNQNQHYQGSYVLAPTPANTIINQNGEQDLAAAAMGAPPQSQQYQCMTPSGSSGMNISSQHAQSMINRAMAHVSQSPLRRIGLNHSSNNAISSTGILNHLSASLHQPIRAGHSSLSLASSSFILEDKLQNEIRKLHSDLKSEKEKNEALNSQLNINSSLMAAFEQSLTTLNTRLRQLTTLNEKKDVEIQEMKEQLESLSSTTIKNSDLAVEDNSSNFEHSNISLINSNINNNNNNSERDESRERDLMKTIEDLRRQLIEKDRLLTDTRLEALSAAHQLEQLESKLNGEQTSFNIDDDLDEGVMVVNHSPSDSEAVTDSAHFSETTNQINFKDQTYNGDSKQNSTTIRNGNNLNSTGSPDHLNIDDHSNHSSEYQIEIKEKEQQSFESGLHNENDTSLMMGKLMDNLLLSSS